MEGDKGTYKETCYQSFIVGSANGDVEIAQVWKQHYETLLNSTPIDMAEKTKITDKINNIFSADKVEAIEIVNAVKKLKLGKSKGIDGLKAEHYKYASNRLCILFTLCLNAMIIHGYMCDDLMKTVIVPIVKDKNEDLSNVDNYRPIALLRHLKLLK